MECFMITVNDKNITEKELDLACNDFITSTGKAKLTENDVLAIVNQLIDSLLLSEEAKKEDLEVSNDEIIIADNYRNNLQKL